MVLVDGAFSLVLFRVLGFRLLRRLLFDLEGVRPLELSCGATELHLVLLALARAEVMHSGVLHDEHLAGADFHDVPAEITSCHVTRFRVRPYRAVVLPFLFL